MTKKTLFPIVLVGCMASCGLSRLHSEPTIGTNKPRDVSSPLTNTNKPVSPTSANEASERLKQLDKNFQNKTEKQSLQWIDAFDKRIALRGLGWSEENRKMKNFRRLPDRAANSLPQGVQTLSHCPSSVFLSFFTDSPDISVRLSIADLGQMDHMPASGMSGAELYFREGSQWYSAGVAKPGLTELSFTRSLMEGATRQRREYRLYLPLYKNLKSAAIGLSPDAKIEPAEGRGKPVFFYGTSITQGGCASTTGSDFVSTLGRTLDTEVINFGFSGNGRGEPEMAKLISEIDAEAFVLDYVANVDPEPLRKTLPDFVAILRAKHPLTPIVLISNVPYNQTLWNAKTRDNLDKKRDIMMEFYLAAKQAGDANLHFIDGDGLLPIGASGMYVDGVHPTSGGFAVIAERLAPQLARILLWSRSKN